MCAFDESTARGYPTGEVLERHLQLATEHRGETVPTIAALMLFGRDDSVAHLLPRSQIIATRFGGDNNQAPIVERAELRGNLGTVYESSLRFISRYADLWEERPSLPRNQADHPPGVPPRARYHRGAVSEALANGIVHRDFAMRDITTRIHVFDRSLEIVNARRSAGFAPGGLKAARFGIQQRLNPQMASIFSNPAYGLSLVSGGLPMLLRESRAFSGRLPDVAALNDEFRLRLHGI